MKTNVQISFVSVDAGLNFSPSGVDILYTYNQIPYATVELTPDLLPLFCDFETVRRKKATIHVVTTEGCITFDGLIDGLTMHQSVGNITFRLVVKSTFQVLLECYPKLPGLHPASIGLFSRNEILKVNPDAQSYLDTVNIGSLVKPDSSKNVIDFALSCTKAFVANQEHIELFSAGNPDAYKIVEVAKALATTTLPLAKEKLERINTTYVDGMTITASDYSVSNVILQQLVETGESIFDNIIKICGLFGVAFVVGNESAYFVPDVGFLKMQHDVSGKVSSTVNVVYPSQYDSFSFDDNGYRDIKACYVLSDENATYQNKPMVAELGGYVDEDPKVTGGVLIVALPVVVALGSAGKYFEQLQVTHQAVQAGIQSLKDVLTAEQIQQQLNEAENNFKLAAIDVEKRFVKSWAQLKYCQAKYMDRNGSYRTLFNPNVAPASMGRLYTKHPGTYIDHYVTTVQHSFRLTPPNGGEATTTVNFS